MRAVIVRSLLVVGAGTAILAAVLYVASTVDARPPEVVATRLTAPLSDDPRIALITTSLEIEFSEPVDEATAETALGIAPPVDGSMSWSGSTLIFTPAAPLALETEYEVRVAAGVVDEAGNAMSEAAEPFTFATAGRPTVVAADPPDGAVDVPVEASLEIVFSTLMDTASVERGLRLEPSVPHELRWSGERLEVVPTEPLDGDREYTVIVPASGADIAGVAIGAPVRITFRTVAPGLAAEVLIPADRTAGIAPATAIGVLFDRGVDPATVSSDALTITPEVAGTLSLVAAPGADPEAGERALLRFTPSGPLRPNTTFEVTLEPGVTAVGGGPLAGPLSWRFTTGPPPAAISNQITFLGDGSGVSNVWAMNSDGTGQRQVSAELAPILDYAVSPDGTSLVVADGRRLVFLRTDGSERRVLTEAGHWDFDPTYAPDGSRVAFARVEAETGAGLGLWEWTIGGGEPERIELPPHPGPDPSAAADDGDGTVLRAPRYAPDGRALAFVDAGGAVGIWELPGGPLTRAPFSSSGPPAWLPDGSGVLLTGSPNGDGAAPRPTAPIGPLDPGPPGPGSGTYRLDRASRLPVETALGEDWRVVAVADDGEVAAVTERGWLGIGDGYDGIGQPPLVRERILAAAFAPGEAAIVVVVADGAAPAGRIERIDLETNRRLTLAVRGWQPRWLP